jgi:hypothetical protein
VKSEPAEIRDADLKAVTGGTGWHSWLQVPLVAASFATGSPAGAMFDGGAHGGRPPISIGMGTR